MGGCSIANLFLSTCKLDESVRPFSTRVNRIPGGLLLVIATLSRIVISKPIYDYVPQGMESLDEQGLREWYPNVVDDKVLAVEIGGFQI